MLRIVRRSAIIAFAACFISVSAFGQAPAPSASGRGSLYERLQSLRSADGPAQTDSTPRRLPSAETGAAKPLTVGTMRVSPPAANQPGQVQQAFITPPGGENVTADGPVSATEKRVILTGVDLSALREIAGSANQSQQSSARPQPRRMPPQAQAEQPPQQATPPAANRARKAPEMWNPPGPPSGLKALQQKLSALRRSSQAALKPLFDRGDKADRQPAEPAATAASQQPQSEEISESRYPATATPYATDNQRMLRSSRVTQPSGNLADSSSEPSPADSRSSSFSEPMPAPALPNATGSVSAERGAPHPAAEQEVVQTSSSARADTLDGRERLLLSLQGPRIMAEASGPRRIMINRPAEFVVTVRNEGDVAADDVLVSVGLPSWADVQSTAASGGEPKVAEKTDTQQPVEWRLPRLAPGDKQRLSLELIPRKSQALDMAVNWTYARSSSKAMVEVQEPLLNMVISGPSEAVYGQKKVYNLTLSNPGTGDAENVKVTLLPMEGKTEAAGTAAIGDLKQGETKTIQVELLAGKSGRLLIRAKATGSGGLVAEAEKEILVRRAELKLDVDAPKSQYAGNLAQYDVKVTNVGNATAEDLTISAIVPEGAVFVSCSDEGRYDVEHGRVRWELPAIGAAKVHKMELVCRLMNPGDNQIRVNVQDNTDLSTVATKTTLVASRADLKLTVLDPAGPVRIGQPATYEIHIKNRGTKTASGIEAVAFFSDGIEPTSVTGSEHEIGRGQVLLKTIPQIEAGSELVVYIEATAQRPGNHVFRAEVLCRPLGTKLAAEETTHFYGSDLTPQDTRTARSKARGDRRQPAPIEIEMP